MSTKKRLPTLFVNHGGGPLPIIGEPSHVDLTNSLKHLTQTLTFNTTIAAILVISAHWEATKFTVLTAEHPSNPIPLYYDYSGFPPESYTYQYNPPGAPKVADRIIALLHNAGLVAEKAQQRQRQGYDHGVFIPLMLSFPDADIPVLQLSLKQGLDPAEHILAGQALAPLRSEGVLIYGSGMSFHNMQHFMGGNSGNSASIQFDNWLNEALLAKKNVVDDATTTTTTTTGTTTGTGMATTSRLERLTDWLSLAPVPREAHPSEEHLIPLFVVAGAAGEDTPCRNIFRGEVLTQKVSSFAFVDEDGTGVKRKSSDL